MLPPTSSQYLPGMPPANMAPRFSPYPHSLPLPPVSTKLEGPPVVPQHLPLPDSPQSHGEVVLQTSMGIFHRSPTAPEEARSSASSPIEPLEMDLPSASHKNEGSPRGTSPPPLLPLKAYKEDPKVVTELAYPVSRKRPMELGPGDMPCKVGVSFEV